MSKPEDKRNDLQRRMRSEWDRRIAHDYRYWMSDGVADNAEMWRVGARDFEILARGVPRGGIALELGCGVGRLLRPAATHFDRVIGFDVSEQAIAKAKELLVSSDNIELVVGNGADLQPLAAGSVDFAFCFAALSSMPVCVIAAYLCELARVVKADGVTRLQVYLGKEQPTAEQDTLAIRSFKTEHFTAAVEQAGFILIAIDELVLPFEISDRESGAIAYIATLKASGSWSEDSESVSKLLLPSGEAQAESWSGSETEYLMALARAQQSMDAGDLAGTEQALEFAVTHYKAAEDSVRQMLAELKLFRAKKTGEEQTLVVPTEHLQPKAVGGDIFEKNMSVLRERFPAVARRIDSLQVSSDVRVERSAQGAPVIFWQDKPLDHVEKPAQAARAWTERILNNPHMAATENLIVAGFAGGYHIRTLLERMKAALHVVEPNPAVLRVALELTDCSDILQSIASLILTDEELTELVGSLAGSSKFEMVTHPQTKLTHRQSVDNYKRVLHTRRGLEQLKPNIAVVGPIYGGSLPIARYTADALVSLGQHVKYYDLGSFFGGYEKVRSMVKNERRRGSLESQYVDFLSQAVLEALTERPVDILICLAQAPLSGEVLTELRKRGVITVMWFVEDCRRFTTWQQISRYFDYMFIIQEGEFSNLVERAGAGRAVYLPTACDPLVHRPLDLSAEDRARWGSAVSFVGAGYHNRQQMFASLTQFDFKIWGSEWPSGVPFDRLVQERGRRVAPEEYVKIFNASEINLNLHSSSERDGVEPYGDFINPRTFELASSGAFQLVDNRLQLPELFEIGTEVITFADAKELTSKIEYYLNHPEERKAVTERARARVLKEHTYPQRIREMLGHIFADRFEELRSRAQASPWTKVIESSSSYPALQERFEHLRQTGFEPTIESIAAEIQMRPGKLNPDDQRLLFLHHVKKQVDLVRELRGGADA